MLAEKLSEIPDSQILMINTDGLEILIPNNIHCNNMYNNICNYWENLTKLNLEHNIYSKLWLADINNYGCIDTKGKIKNKGRFEVDKVVGSEPAYHKDNSFRIVPLALQEFFVNNIPVEDTIKKHNNIYDFCGRQKFKGNDYGTISYIDGNHIASVKQQKNVRYYISNKGSVFTKHYSKGTLELINKSYLVTIFNNYIEKPINEYNINYDFYIKECYKEINIIIDKQLTLF